MASKEFTNSRKFARFSEAIARGAGSPWAIAGATIASATWLAAGPIFSWSNTWQSVGEITMSVVTFLIVFLLQSSANRNSAAAQAKSDELISATPGARNELIREEERAEDEIEENRV